MLRTGLLLAAAMCSLPALADTHISYVDDSGQLGTQIYVKSGKVRLDERTGSIIYDTVAGTATLLLPEERAYVVLDGSNAARYGVHRDEMNKLVQSASAPRVVMTTVHVTAGGARAVGMRSSGPTAAAAPVSAADPGQRRYGDHTASGPGSASAGVNIRAMPANSSTQTSPSDDLPVLEQDLGTTETIAGQRCRDVELRAGRRDLGLYCIVDSAVSLGIPDTDLKTLEATRAGAHRLSALMGPSGRGDLSYATLGFFLKSTHLMERNGLLYLGTETLHNVNAAAVDASLFTPPAGYLHIPPEAADQPLMP